MPNPIADPIVENVISDDLEGLARLEATTDGVAVVSISRTAAGNALDGPTVEALREIFETLHAAEEVRIVFLRGEGGTFCAGEDPEWTLAAAHWDEGAARDDANAVGAMLKALSDVPALTVALIEGEAVGIGAGLAAACDVGVATRGARFAFPEVRLGLLPGPYAPYVVDAIGPRAAKALFATGCEIDAETARGIGLVQSVVDSADGLLGELDRLSGAAMEAAPEAVRLAKALVRDLSERHRGRDMTDELARLMGRRRLSDEGREGAAARAEGRPPSWRSEA